MTVIYLKLFLSFFQIGLLSIGGGYAYPLIQNQIVDKQMAYHEGIRSDYNSRDDTDR